MQVPSCPAGIWHFKRELAVLSPDEVPPRRWENTLLPFCASTTSAQWGSTFRVYLGSGSKVWASGVKQLALVLLGTPPNQEPQPHPRRGLGLTVTPEGHRACHRLPCQALGQGDWTENLATSKLTLAGGPEPQPHPHMGSPSSDLWVPSSSVNSRQAHTAPGLQILYIEKDRLY